MGFFDDIFADVRAFTDEMQSLKDELVTSVLDPTGQLRDTVNEIAGEITGNPTPFTPVDPANPATTPSADDPIAAATAAVTTATAPAARRGSAITVTSPDDHTSPSE